MESEDFKSFNMVKSAIVNRKKTIDKEKVDWLQMRWIWFEQSHPFWIQYRFTHNELEPWKTIDVKRRQKGRPPDLGRIALPLLWEEPRGVDHKKLSDIMSLLEFVPPIHHDFYKKLEVSGTGEEDKDSSEKSESEGEGEEWDH